MSDSLLAFKAPEPPEYRPDLGPDDAAWRAAVRIVQSGAGIMLPFGVESSPVGVRFDDRIALAKRIAAEIRLGGGA